MNKTELIRELQCALPTKRILEVVRTARVVIGEEVIVLKVRDKDGLLADPFVIKAFEGPITENDLQFLQNKNIQLQYSAFTQRGKNAIVDYLTEIQHQKIKEIINYEEEKKDLLEALKNARKKQSRPESNHYVRQGVKDHHIGNAVPGEIQQNEKPCIGKSVLGEMPNFADIISEHRNLSILNFTSGNGKTLALANFSKLMSDIFTPENETLLKNEEQTEEEPAQNKPNPCKFGEVICEKAPLALFENASVVAVYVDGKIKIVKDRTGSAGEHTEFIIFTKYMKEHMKDVPRSFYHGKNFLLI